MASLLEDIETDDVKDRARAIVMVMARTFDRKTRDAFIEVASGSSKSELTSLLNHYATDESDAVANFVMRLLRYLGVDLVKRPWMLLLAILIGVIDLIISNGEVSADKITQAASTVFGADVVQAAQKYRSGLLLQSPWGPLGDKYVKIDDVIKYTAAIEYVQQDIDESNRHKRRSE